MKKHNPSKIQHQFVFRVLMLHMYAHIFQEKTLTSLPWTQVQKQKFDGHFLNLDCVTLRLSEDAFLFEGAPSSLSK